MNQWERMVSGQLYDVGDEDLRKARQRAKVLCRQYNDAPPEDDAARADILRRLLGSVGKDCWIEPTLRCDYGTNISVGDNFYANYDCVFLDVAPITIGNNVMVGPRVCFYAAGHPIAASVRNTGLEFGAPITIEDNVWIGGGVSVCPGVTIGAGSIIAAGSVVTRDVPPGVVAGGNPCRVLRPITDADEARWQSQRRAYEEELSTASRQET